MAAMKPLVTVIMPAFNAEKFAQQAIESVLNQTMKNFELVFVNDGSTDNTRKIATGYADSRIRIFDIKPNSGKAHAVNLGLKKARGKFACIFDADDIMANYKLDVSSKILEKHKDCGLLFGNAWIMNAHSEITGPLSFPSRAKKRIDAKFPKCGFSFERLCRECFIPQGSTMFRTSLAKKVHGLDEKLKTGEDWDLWLRLAEKASVFYLPVPLYIYRLNQKGLIGTAKKKELKERSKIIMQKISERKNHGKTRMG